MSKPRRLNLRRRYNKDGSIVLLYRGRVVFKTRDFDHIDHFMKGWYGE
jgi:hypothetical protein